MTWKSTLQEREEAERVHGADPAAAKPPAKGAGTFDPDESLAAAQEAAGVAAEEEQVQPQKTGPTPAQRTAIQVGVLHKSSPGRPPFLLLMRPGIECRNSRGKAV
jgi:hypothetical protein